MAKPQYDGIVAAVHYGPDDEIAWVRVYERRGPTFSDRVIIQRQDLVQRLKAGKRFFVGNRQPYLASTFEVSHLVRLVQEGDHEILVAGEGFSGRDHLADAPAI